ncbi:MAG: DUF2061 domain-containing protein [Candidatus Aenigmarchaeota archaeon]|nr:DUF2061 domain-containing protein [Candidatus Aenigmarchaeota archaeon]
MDSRKRSIAKTISWRAFIILVDTIILFFITGSMAISGSVAVGLNMLKTLMYYFHERFWENLEWGRK